MKTALDRDLHSLVTQWDALESKRPHHNPHALGIYFQRVAEVLADVERGADVRAAVIAGFCGRLVDFILRGLKLKITTKFEARGGFCYYPVTEGGAK